jgi:hypothetical protein
MSGADVLRAKMSCAKVSARKCRRGNVGAEMSARKCRVTDFGFII